MRRVQLGPVWRKVSEFLVQGQIIDGAVAVRGEVVQEKLRRQRRRPKRKRMPWLMIGLTVARDCRGRCEEWRCNRVS